MKKWVVAGLLLVSACVGLVMRKEGYFSYDNFINFLGAYPFLAPFIFIFIFSVAPTFFIPTLPLNILAGFLWGPMLGTLYAFIGSTAGASISFLVGRYLGAEFCRKKLNNEKWEWLLTKMDQDGWKILAFVKLSPVLPSNLISYLFGISRMTFKMFFCVGSLFVFPPTLAISLLGNTMKDSLVSGEIIIWKVSLVLAIFMGLFVIHQIFKRRKKVNATY